MEKVSECDGYTVHHSMADGIERISYLPHTPQSPTPLLLQHGMWHGAWVWSQWQEIFARAGYESHAYSLPGHGRSPVQRPTKLCTLGYYRKFLNREVERLDTLPVLVGHSMGGALVQRFLKYDCDDLPAAILLAPWTLRSTYADGLLPMLRRDPLGALWALCLSAHPFVRSPKRAAQSFIGPGALYTPEELYQRLDRESGLLLLQHNPPFWFPKKDFKTPLLWMAGERDALITEKGARKSARLIGAEYICVPQAAHNLMVEASYIETANNVLNWLEEKLPPSAKPAPSEVLLATAAG